MTAPVASKFTLPTIAAEAAPANMLAVAPVAPSLVLRKNDAIPADTPELHTLLVARQAHAIFDKQSGAYGDSPRLPITRFIDKLDEKHGKLILTTGGWTVAVSTVGALATVVIPALGSLQSLFIWGVCTPIGAAVAGVVAGLASTHVENSRAREQRIPAKALEPLRTLFDAREGSPLERAVLVKLAKSYADDLDDRKTRGEASRTVLRDIIEHGETIDIIDADTQTAAQAIVDCFNLTHDELGELRSRLADDDALHLEYAIADMTPENAAKVKPMLLALLYVDDVSRTKMDYGVEARLYRVLTGLEPPRKRPLKPMLG